MTSRKKLIVLATPQDKAPDPDPSLSDPKPKASPPGEGEGKVRVEDYSSSCRKWFKKTHFLGCRENL
jgi:hypothetical protein